MFKFKMANGREIFVGASSLREASKILRITYGMNPAQVESYTILD